MPPDTTSYSTLHHRHDSFLPLHFRLFISLLARLDYNDLQRREFFIPIAELLPNQREAIVYGDSTYHALQGMSQLVLSIGLHIDEPATGKYGAWTMIESTSYDEERGHVRVKFTADILPYLLRLHQGGNYPLADLNELLALRPADAQHLFGLLQEHGTFRHPAIDRDQLQGLLGRVPKRPSSPPPAPSPAREELKATALPFVYEVHRDGRLYKNMRVVFPNKTDRVRVLRSSFYP